MEVAIISEKLFIENGPIKETTLVSKFIPYIILAQKIYLEPILGKALLTQLQTQIKAASGYTPPDPPDPPSDNDFTDPDDFFDGGTDQPEDPEEPEDPEINPITPHNQALLLEIAPVLSMYAVYQGLPFHWAAIVNKGVTLRESENSEGVELKTLSQLRRWVKDDAETLAKQLVRYLCSCKGNYPLWAPTDEYGCGSCEDNATLSPRDHGIFIPKRKRKCC